MAPGAELLVGKVLGDDGSGTLSGIVDGMEWAVAQGAQVVSMSLGADGATSCAGPDVEAVQRLGSKALFVIAAGNASLRGTVSTPGCAPGALTVGAVDRKNETASFSSRGPSADGINAKPDIASQGVDVVAARAERPRRPGVPVDVRHLDGHPARHAAAPRSCSSSTPAWRPPASRRCSPRRRRTPTPPSWTRAAGPMDVARATTQPVVGDPNPLLGDFAYPQAGLDPVDHAVTLTNVTDKDVTLALAVSDVRGDDGSRVRGFASAARTRVTVPANGTADVPVRIDPAAKLDAGDYGTLTGRLVGTGAHGVRVTVPFGVHLEVPSADLTVKGLDRHGDPASSLSTFQLFDDHRDSARRYTIGYPTMRQHHDPGAARCVLPRRDDHDQGRAG